MKSEHENITEFKAADKPGGSPSKNLSWLEANRSRLIWTLAFLGIAVRLEQYFFNRSLWHDEAMMALNILHRSFAQLTQPLDFHLVGPFGWLWAEKACNLLFGNHEFALRLPQILSGVAAMLLLPVLAQRLLPARAVLIAVAWFALSPPLIYYASELKPYGSDAAVALLLWLLAFRAIDGKPSWQRIAVLALGGGAAIWFSHPALFVIAGLTFAIVGSCIATRDWHRLVAFLPAFFAWAGSFALSYAVTLRSSSHDPGLLSSYPFAKLTAHFGDLEAMLQSVFVLQQNPITILLGVAVLAFVVGCLYFWRHNRTAFWLLLSPILFGFLASSLHRYPLMGRFFMFATPAVAIVVAAGADQLWLATRSSPLPIGATLVALLFFQPVFSTVELVLQPIRTVELRPVLQYVRRHQHPGDIWYVYCYGRFTFEYYAEAYEMDSNNVVIGSCFTNFRNSIAKDVVSAAPTISEPLLKSDHGWRWFRTGNLRYNWDFPQQDFSQLRGNRVWVIFAQIQTADGVDERALTLQVLDTMGKQVDSHTEPGSLAYLYDLTAVRSAATSQ